MAVKHVEYWTKREEEATKRRIVEEKAYERELQKIYENMLDNVQKEIDAFYGKYAKENNITLAEAKKAVSTLDIKAYERKAKRYVKDRDFSKEANEEMRLYNLTMKVNRLEMLKANIGLEMISGHDELQKHMESVLKGRTMDELERQAGILGKTIRNNAKLANAIVNASFHNATFSDRIWMHQDLLKNELNNLLQTGLIAGRNPRVLAREIKNKFGAKRADAERLMRTELARVQTEAQRQSFEANGFTQYIFLALGDACDICKEIDEEHYNVEDMMPGKNAPPMHPHCRCSTAAYEDSDEYNAWLEYLENGGTTEEWEALDAEEKQKWLDKVKGKNPLTYEEMKQQIADDKKRARDIGEESIELDRKIAEYERKEKEFAGFEGLNKEEISSRIKTINDRLAELEAINDKWYDRPERGTEEYKAWREWKRSIDFDATQEELYKLQDERFDLDRKLSKLGDYEAWKKWKKENPIDKLRANKAKLATELETIRAKIANTEKVLASKSFVEDLKYNKVDYREVSKNKKPLKQGEIIKVLAGGDRTRGSCASVGLAYIGQRLGYNVRDFRGGKSQDLFANYRNLAKIHGMPGIKAFKTEGASSQTVGVRLLEKCVPGKEYYLATGRHAAIVRKTEDGRYQYLELQSGTSNGWMYFKDDPRETLRWRFGCSRKSDNNYASKHNFMIDIDESDFSTKEFEEILGYINTAEEEQRKGRDGTIK